MCNELKSFLQLRAQDSQFVNKCRKGLCTYLGEQQHEDSFPRLTICNRNLGLITFCQPLFEQGISQQLHFRLHFTTTLFKFSFTDRREPQVTSRGIK